MKVEKAIRQRRSIRQYLDKMPKDKDIERILDCTIWAPSGLNNQPWKFKILKGSIKDGLSEFTRYGKIIKNAPVAICVFLDHRATYNRDKDIMAIGALIQSMLLEAYELGLGTCWLGEILNKRREVEEYLKIDPDYELMAVVTLGYSDEEDIVRVHRKELKSFILD